MANEDDVLPPAIEIPWRLASTTLPFNNTGPDQTSISLFTFQPDDEDLTATFPDERLVFIKVTTSIAPGPCRRVFRVARSAKAFPSITRCSIYRCA